MLLGMFSHTGVKHLMISNLGLWVFGHRNRFSQTESKEANPVSVNPRVALSLVEGKEISAINYYYHY